MGVGLVKSARLVRSARLARVAKLVKSARAFNSPAELYERIQMHFQGIFMTTKSVSVPNSPAKLWRYCTSSGFAESG
jgi:hypothetical protein